MNRRLLREFCKRIFLLVGCNHPYFISTFYYGNEPKNLHFPTLLVLKINMTN